MSFRELWRTGISGPMNAARGTRMEISEGKPYPLGATADEKGANFAVFSANATRVEVCFFDTDGTSRDRPLRIA